MDELSKEYIIDFFTKRLIHFKDAPESVGWTKKGQILRYEVVLKFIEHNPLSILDFGCGKGDFLSFLKNRGINCQYTGIDINPSLIELARKNHSNAKFYVQDIETEPLERSFQYVIAIGVFNLAVQHLKESMKKCVEILFNHTEKKLIFTCLNERTKLRDINVSYFAKEELEEIAKKLTNKYRIDESIIEGDLFLILQK